MVALHQHLGHTVGDAADDLLAWLRRLESCPPVSEAVLVGCRHDDADAVGWSYIEADAAAGVARRRCVACAVSISLLDSDERWTYPPMFCCPLCQGSIVELGVALSSRDRSDAAIAWLAVGVRCVGCGVIKGVTDFCIEARPGHEVIAAL